MPNNSDFYHAAYVIAALIYALYALSIVRRTQKLGRRREG
jgi:hypothetical protein